MRPKSRAGKSVSPIDAKKLALRQELEKLREREKELEDLIKEAPRLQEEEKKRRQGELASLAGRGSHRINAPSSIERPYHFHGPSSRAPRKSLKAEKRQARLQFYVLFLILALALACVYYKVIR